MTPALPLSLQRQRRVQRVLYLTLALNVLVLLVKLGLGFVTGSLSLVADALHSVTDSANNILGLVAMHFSSPEPDEDHPYGHSKFEALGALGIAAFLAIACLEIMQMAISRFFGNAVQIEVTDLALQLMVCVMLINIGVALYERHQGKVLASRLLQADARHTFSDIWITMTVLVGLIGVQQGWPWLDQVMALPVAVLVIRSAWQILQDNIPYLTDTVAIPPQDLRKLLMQVFRGRVLDCHAITSRGIAGQMVFIEMHMVVVPTDVAAAHLITEEVERVLEAQYGPVRVTIHLEPYSHIEPLSK